MNVQMRAIVARSLKHIVLQLHRREENNKERREEEMCVFYMFCSSAEPKFIVQK